MFESGGNRECYWLADSPISSKSGLADTFIVAFDIDALSIRCTFYAATNFTRSVLVDRHFGAGI